MSYKTETIKNTVINISKNEYLLPAIQRELVWKPRQIEKLFDSVLSGYPFGSLLFWHYKNNDRNQDYKFYEFLKKYDEYKPSSNHNKEHVINIDDEIVGILDGQQRLTALFLGLRGSLNLHIPRKRRNKADNFEEKHLFINLLYSRDTEDEYDDIKPKFNLKFKNKEQARKENLNENVYWYELKNALNWEEKRCWKKVRADIRRVRTLPEEQEEIIEEVCSAIYENILSPSNPRISYYQENTKSLDEILNIFVRINSGGTPLGYTDFLMSMIINQWGDGREKINEAIDSIASDFHFDIPKDVFLRACLFLTGENLQFKADNFKQNTIRKIKDQFDDITKCLRISCQIFRGLGYSKDNLKSNLILLPLAWYLKANDVAKVSDVGEADLEEIKKWIQLSILARVFGSHTNTYLARLRSINDGWVGEFPLDSIIKNSNGPDTNMNFNEDRLDDIIKKAKKGSQESWALLTLLYPSNNYSDVVFHEDHIYPYSKLTTQQRKEGGDYISNIQLLEGRENRKKNATDPREWMIEYCGKKGFDINQYKKDNFIPKDIELSPENFEDFLEARKSLIKEELLKILKR